jgi:hypothetical protein
VLQKGAHDVLRTADVAGRRRAHLHEVFPDRVLVIHGVERHHAFDIGRRQAQDLGHLRHSWLADPAALPLHDPERRQQRGHLGRVVGEHLIQFGAVGADEDWPVVVRAVCIGPRRAR